MILYMQNNQQQRAAGLLFLRLLLGVIFLMQGYGKIFTIGVGKLYGMFFASYEAMLPKWLLWSTAYYTSYIELIGGALLIVGLCRRRVLYLLALCLVIVSFGHGLAEPIWDLQHLFPRAVLLGALLLLPAEWDRWCADGLLRKKAVI
jgi:uncharacterized membrane protein YphA (DoxX/SURF4 family)